MNTPPPFSRRSFLIRAARAGAVLPFAAWACDGQNPAGQTYFENIGVQLYTFREALEENPEPVLNQLASIGFRNLEMANAGRLDVIPPIALELGMEVSSFHLPHELITDPSPQRELEASHLLRKAVRYGLQYAVLAWLPPEHRGNLSDYQRLADRLNNLGKIGQDAGIQVAYHHHAFEFEPKGARTPFALLMAETDPELITLELDVFWCTIAGQDPVSVMDRYASRIRQLHLKDLLPKTPQTYGDAPPEAFREVGSGQIDFRSVLTKAREIGVQYAYIEQDHTQGPPMESVRKSYRYLQELGL